MHLPNRLGIFTLAGALAVTAAVPVTFAKSEGHGQGQGQGKVKTEQVRPTPGAKSQGAEHRSAKAAEKSHSPVNGTLTPGGEQAVAAQAQAVATPRPVKKDACEKVITKIQKRSDGISERAVKLTAHADGVFVRVQDFYQGTVIPAGGEVENYGELLADIQAKRAAVETATSQATATVDAFDCAGDTHGQVATFRTDIKGVQSALKAYRASIHALIEAVDTAYAAVPTPEPTPTDEPTPDVSPEPTPSQEPVVVTPA